MNSHPGTSSMYNETMNSNIYDLYEVGDLREEDGSLPFVHRIVLAGLKGEVVRLRSMFDDGASINAIDETLYQTLKGRLMALMPYMTTKKIQYKYPKRKEQGGQS